MEGINVLIVEDMSLIADDIASKLARNAIGVSGICASGEEAIDLVAKCVPDLILMDIQLAGSMDGISTARVINKERDIPIIYLTEHVEKETVDRAKKTLPSQYLSKPFHEGDLIRAIEIAITNWQAQDRGTENLLRDHIFIKVDQTYVKIWYNDIIYLKADRSYCNIITATKTYIQSNNMNYVLSQIKSKDFIRVHRSHAVNKNKITKIDGNIIRLGDHNVEMSKGMREEVLSQLNLL